MKKGSGTKTRISITIDNDLASQINKICEKKLMKVSSFVEMLIKKGLKDER
ncbi:hypothetical protein KY331_04340 [Candidatus Woesearchaeota archaeon]|nr:hypothetical protein [Candidatus Woesearchaeota archaeon]